MTKNYDKEFGPDGLFAWPACTDVAERFLKAAPFAKSGPDCLNDEFFYDDYDDCEGPRINSLDSYIFLNCPDELAVEFAEAAAKEREQLFQEAISWPLPYLVASATYKILSVEPEVVRIVTPLWDCFLWPFLCFDEPLSDMLRSKGWGEIYKNNMRKGLKSQLRAEINVYTGRRLMWGRDQEKPWFTVKGFTSHIYPKDVLRCLELVGIDPPLADSAVEQVFKLQSLTPLYDVLSDKPFSSKDFARYKL